MNLFRRFWNWLTKEQEPTYESVTEAPVAQARNVPEPPTPQADLSYKLEEAIKREWLPKPAKKMRRLYPKRTKPKHTHHDLSRHMAGKGKGQHRWYRRSVKEHLPVEENDSVMA